MFVKEKPDKKKKTNIKIGISFHSSEDCGIFRKSNQKNAFTDPVKIRFTQLVSHNTEW